jgi:tRNA(fMet)-specific endonuclease VapC
MRGWMAAIRRIHVLSDQVGAYMKLRRLFQFFSVWHILDFDQSAAQEFERLRMAKLHVGTMDMKIASIALGRNAADITDTRCLGPGDDP